MSAGGRGPPSSPHVGMRARPGRCEDPVKPRGWRPEGGGGGARGELGACLEEGRTAATTLSLRARRKRARLRAAVAMQRRRRLSPPASHLREDCGGGGGRGGGEVEVQFSAGRLGSVAVDSAATVAVATRNTEEEEERLEREHFWKIINAFRYYG